MRARCADGGGGKAAGPQEVVSSFEGVRGHTQTFSCAWGCAPDPDPAQGVAVLAGCPECPEASFRPGGHLPGRGLPSGTCTGLALCDARSLTPSSRLCFLL